MHENLHERKKKKPHFYIYILGEGGVSKYGVFSAETNTVFSFDFLIPNGKVNESEKSLHK